MQRKLHLPVCFALRRVLKQEAAEVRLFFSPGISNAIGVNHESGAHAERGQAEPVQEVLPGRLCPAPLPVARQRGLVLQGSLHEACVHGAGAPQNICEALGDRAAVLGSGSHHVDHHLPALQSRVGRGGGLPVLHHPAGDPLREREREGTPEPSPRSATRNHIHHVASCFSFKQSHCFSVSETFRMFTLKTQ